MVMKNLQYGGDEGLLLGTGKTIGVCGQSY
jgi:hypothetical protein